MRPARRRARCPICRRAIGRPPKNRWFPFCSEHCRLVDLGRWLDDAYRIPGPEKPPPESDDSSVH
jgi:endogenous inhibitor of DNA gyrase (YacG/DUF329 family)